MELKLIYLFILWVLGASLLRLRPSLLHKIVGLFVWTFYLGLTMINGPFLSFFLVAVSLGTIIEMIAPLVRRKGKKL